MIRSESEQQDRGPIIDAIHRFQRLPLCAFVVHIQVISKLIKTSQSNE
jgi:hypothetical protein